MIIHNCSLVILVRSLGKKFYALGKYFYALGKYFYALGK